MTEQIIPDTAPATPQAPGYLARKRSAVYSGALGSNKTQYLLSGASAFGLGYGVWTGMDWATADATMQSLVNFGAGLLTAAASYTWSVSALRKAAQGDRISLYTSRVLANGMGIGCFLALVPLCAYAMPHIPIVSALENVKGALAYVPAYLLAVPAAHFYKRLLDRKDLYPDPVVETKPAPPKTFEERQAEYEQSIKDRDAEKDARTSAETRERWQGFFTRAAATVIFTGFLCYSDAAFPHNNMSVETIKDYLVNNAAVVGMFGAIGGFISAGFLENKLKLAYNALWAGTALTALAAYNGFDVAQLKSLFATPASVGVAYTESLLKTPLAALALGVGYLKWPNAMNNVFIHGVPNAARFAGRYYLDPKKATKGALSYMASMKFWGGVGNKGAETLRTVAVTTGKYAGMIGLPLLALEGFQYAGLSPVGGGELGAHLVGVVREAFNFSATGAANEVLQFGRGMVTNLLSGDVQFKIAKVLTTVASGYFGAVGGKYLVQKTADYIGGKVDTVADTLTKPVAPTANPI